jgi:secreted PhoX family phosphatase
MERRELLKIAASLGVMGVAGRFVTACSSGTPVATPTTSSAGNLANPAGSSVPGTAAGGTSTTMPKGYGPLGAPDANGVRLPEGFTSRIIATSGQPVAGTDYVWHDNPDGGACFAVDGGGWVYVSNSESGPAQGGGVSMVRFAKDGTVVEARRILANTARNCAGGATPWGTWLSCEEIPQGKVFECYPLDRRDAEARPALGVFNHEAVAVDPDGKALYLTEDQPDGGLYRFRPTAYPDLSAGTLDVLTEEAGALAWVPVPDPSAVSTETRKQVPAMKIFNGGEGICFHDGSLFFTTKGDNRVWQYEPATNKLSVFYDAATSATPVLTGVDNITAAGNGDLFVAEDGGDMQVVQLFDATAAAVAQVENAPGSEITGPAFNPDGTRLYFSSQRSPGVTYEVSGPWNNT